MGVSLSIPVVTKIGLTVRNGIPQVQKDRSSSKVAGPSWEITLHIQFQPSTAHAGAYKSIGVRFGLTRVGLHCGIAVRSVKGYLITSPHVYHLDIFVLKQIGHLYSSNVVERIFELVIWGQGWGEGYVQDVSRCWVCCYVAGLVACIEFVCDGACSPPYLGVEGVCAVVLLVGVGHTSQPEGV